MSDYTQFIKAQMRPGSERSVCIRVKLLHCIYNLEPCSTQAKVLLLTCLQLVQ